MSSSTYPIIEQNLCPTRRRLVQGIAVDRAFAGVEPGVRALAAPTQQQRPQTLHGTGCNPIVGNPASSSTWAPPIATTVIGLLWALIRCWRDGDVLTLPETDPLQEAGSIHSHGTILPSAGKQATNGLERPTKPRG